MITGETCGIHGRRSENTFHLRFVALVQRQSRFIFRAAYAVLRNPSPEKAAMDAKWNAILHRLMDALPEDLRQPLALSAIEELESPR